jgi:hypothetical protein
MIVKFEIEITDDQKLQKFFDIFKEVSVRPKEEPIRTGAQTQPAVTSTVKPNPVVTQPASAPTPQPAPQPAPQPEPDPVEEPKTLDDIRALIMQIKPEVSLGMIQDILAQLNVGKLSEIPEDKYPWVYAHIHKFFE